MQLTKRNHYTPCFWAALWNETYYRSFLAGMVKGESVRGQRVHALSVKSGRLLETTVENDHFDKNLGMAEITRESAEDFVKRHHPDKFEAFARTNATAEYPVFLDFEDILSGLERTAAYQTLMEVAKVRRIRSAVDRGFLACFLALQHQRCHAIMTSMIQLHVESGRHKFEHFVTLKWMLESPETLGLIVAPLAFSRWTLFSSERFLPLCDSPVLLDSESLMIALSPHLLLHADLKSRSNENEQVLVVPLADETFEEFRRRTIGNTFREIIGDEAILETWKASEEFQARAELMKDAKRYNELVWQEGSKELWRLNKYGGHK